MGATIPHRPPVLPYSLTNTITTTTTTTVATTTIHICRHPSALGSFLMGTLLSRPVSQRPTDPRSATLCHTCTFTLRASTVRTPARTPHAHTPQRVCCTVGSTKSGRVVRHRRPIGMAPARVRSSPVQDGCCRRTKVRAGLNNVWHLILYFLP